MLVVNDPLRKTDLPSDCIMTIGNFDGMHIGHQAIIQRVIERARAVDRPSVVMTFQPHPLSVVAPDRVPKQILTLAQKEEILAGLGVDALVVIPFTHEFSRLTAHRFAHDYITTGLRAREVHIGRDFCFGAGREGDFELLREIGAGEGFTVHRADDVRVRGIRVSSSLIRTAVSKGAIRLTALALGRTYYLDGRVATGRRLGRKIGFPTVNVDATNDLFPGSGVYVTTSRFETFSGTFQGVTNIGVRPTLYENYAMTIESHILDFDSNVYGDMVRVYFHKLLRREQQFRSALELTNQIREDIERSRNHFRRHPELAESPT